MRRMAENQPWRSPLCFNPLLLCNLTSNRPADVEAKSLSETSKYTPKTTPYNFRRFSFGFYRFCLRFSMGKDAEANLIPWLDRNDAFTSQDKQHIDVFQTKRFNRMYECPRKAGSVLDAACLMLTTTFLVAGCPIAPSHHKS